MLRNERAPADGEGKHLRLADELRGEELRALPGWDTCCPGKVRMMKLGRRAASCG